MTDPDFAATALRIARDLAEAAAPAPGGVHWSGPRYLATVPPPHIAHADLGPGVYAGAAGISLFLACAAPLDRTGQVGRTAHLGARWALRSAGDLTRAGRHGLLDGAVGVALGAALTGHALGDGTLVTAARRIVHGVADGTPPGAPPTGPDVVSGGSGTLLGLLAAGDLLDEETRERLRRVVVPAAHGLADTSRPRAWGRSWGDRAWAVDLLGLAHGASGVALALTEVGTPAGDARLAAVARDAVRYENGWFSPERSAWPDLRDPDPGPADPDPAPDPGAEAGPDADSEPAEQGAGQAAPRPRPWPAWPSYWCHGALGIGLARLRLFQLTGDRSLLPDISAAAQAARDVVVRAGTDFRSGGTPDASLCHGLTGTAELFLTAGQVLRVPEHTRAATQVGRLLLDLARRDDGRWRCGMPVPDQSPSLFLGLAGIGLTLLRLHDPRSAPSLALPGPGGGWAEWLTARRTPVPA
ncbi:lanthionine synthetase LanC family protein [Allostreptomyces psammosilenae]|uniref:Lantibiotic modifying enzyme n=1 Tax=Allostreptomyces psammosilenae TaxID=1892865 RepID=A0A852ZPM0_9ACTN|nr:lanthionine synthetase LanC family protein [Allostreptomyces psammosilenae]NYI04396.1 lantibiotic modifying enzyme [Allostreptomyces psammosilenae]